MSAKTRAIERRESIKARGFKVWQKITLLYISILSSQQTVKSLNKTDRHLEKNPFNEAKIP